MKSNPPVSNQFNLTYAIFACINTSLGFCYIYNTSVFNSVLTYLENYVFSNVSSNTVVFIASSPIITSILGSLFGGSLAQKFGRRRTLMTLDVLLIISVLLTLLTTIPIIIIGRLIEGFIYGCNMVINPLYCIETAPVPYRGPLSTGPGIFASSGSLIAFGFGFLIPKTLEPGETSGTWRIVLGFPILIAVTRIISFLVFFRDETPFYLVSKNQIEKARKAIEKVYNEKVQERLDEIIQERDYMNSSGKVTLSNLFQKKYRKAFFVGVAMMSMQSLCGLSVILVYSNKIFKNGITDPNDNLPLILSNCMGAFNLGGAMLAILTMKRFSRKKLLVFGAFLTGGVQIVFAVVALATSSANIASKIFLVIWPIPYGLTFGPVIYAMVPETLPEIGVSISSVCSCVLSFLTVQYYPSISDAIGVSMTFIIMGGITILSGVLFMFTAVETRNRTKDEILKDYNRSVSEISQTFSKQLL